MTRLLLVRHARSMPPTPEGPDEHARPLSAAGLRQARELVALLAPYAPVRVLSSPFQRAVQTVLPTAAVPGLEVETRPELREWRSGIGPTPSWEPHYRECWQRPDCSVAGGETHAALQERAGRALAEIASEGAAGPVVVGSHGTWIARALVGQRPRPPVDLAGRDDHLAAVLAGGAPACRLPAQEAEDRPG